MATFTQKLQVLERQKQLVSQFIFSKTLDSRNFWGIVITVLNKSKSDITVLRCFPLHQTKQNCLLKRISFPFRTDLKQHNINLSIEFLKGYVRYKMITSQNV